MSNIPQDEENAFFEHGTDRAAAIVWCTIIENRITAYIKARLRQDQTVFDELFQPGAPLFNFGAKIRLIYMACWIDREVYRDLLIINKIRNEFAHSIKIRDFESDKIKHQIDNLHVLKTLRLLSKDIKSKENKTKFEICDDFVLDESLKTVRGCFRECCRMLMFQVADATALQIQRSEQVL